MDFRIQGTLTKLLTHLQINEGTFDRVSVAGGAGNFEQLSHHLGLSKKLHASQVAILTIHEDCGAGAKKEDLPKAFELASQAGFESRLFFIKLDGTWEEVK